MNVRLVILTQGLTSFFVMLELVDIGIGVVRSISASISDISSVNPFVIVVSPVVDVLNCPPAFPCSELSSCFLLRVKINRPTTISKHSTIPHVTEMIKTK
jgi:hypothetical protein